MDDRQADVMVLDYYWQIFPYTVVAFLSLGVLIAVLNYFTVPVLGADEPVAQFPRVSVLVPARNEELNIRRCIESLLAQDYPAFEVIVLDDHSTDRTLIILEEIAARNPHLQIVRGQPLPDDWLGKHWACHQLAQQATGDYLLFTDADTYHAAHTLRDAVTSALRRDADLLTAFPHEEMFTWGERLAIPLLGFSIFCFLPVKLAEWLYLPAFSVTIGQFMLFRRSAYDAIGGYAAIYRHPVDDVALGRRLVALGLRWRLMDATGHVSCRMYRDLPSALDGFTKNLFAFFDNRVLLYIIGWAWISVAFLAPPFVLLCAGFGYPFAFPLSIAFLSMLEVFLMLGLAYRRSRIPVWLISVYPLSMLIFLFIALRSAVYPYLGASSWKGRKLVPPAFKL